MAIKPVSLTYEGDASLALTWAGFAKKKARQLADWCISASQPTGNNWITPTADVRIRVWYNNGYLKAHIIAEAGGYGFAFKRHDYVNTVDGFWWDIQRPRDNVFIDVSKSQVARGAGAYKVGTGGDIKYGAWMCQETGNGGAITVAENKMFPGRLFPTFPPPTRIYAGRRETRMDVGYPFGNPNGMYANGREYSTAGNDCYGAFKYQGAVISYELTSGYTNSGFTTFTASATMQVVKSSSGFSGIGVVADRTVLATQSVASFSIIPDNGLSRFATGLLAVSSDGSVAVAKYTSSGVKLVYVQMSGTGASISATTNAVSADETNTPADGVTGVYTLPAVAHCGYYDVIHYNGAWIPARAQYVLNSANQSPTPAEGGTVTVIQADFVVYGDPTFTGAFATEVIRVDATSLGAAWTDYIDAAGDTAINLQRGLAFVLGRGIMKLDFDLGTGTVVSTEASGGSLCHTRLDYILSPRNYLLVPQYTDGSLSGYTKVLLENIPGMANALGGGKPATDAYGTYGLLGTI